MTGARAGGGRMRVRALLHSMRRAPGTIAIGLALAIAAPTGCDPEPGGAVARVDTGHLQERLESMRGRPVLLVFWATWCRPCIEEAPELAALHRAAPHGLQVVGVSLDALSLDNDQAATKVAQFLRSTPVPYAQFLYVGPAEPLVEAFQLPNNIPFAILYDARGAPLQRYLGRVSGDTIRAALTSARTG